MSVKRIIIAGVLIATPSIGLASSGYGKAKWHHRHSRLVEPAPPARFAGGRLVMHPAANIACQTRDRAVRALPCDQPVWVYGSPCEIDLGRGRWRECDDPPGVVRGGAAGAYRWR